MRCLCSHAHVCFPLQNSSAPFVFLRNENVAICVKVPPSEGTLTSFVK